MCCIELNGYVADEAIQKRAIQIVLNFSRRMPYSLMLFAADLNSLASRREDIS